jgi:hypothetical protein
MCEGFTWHSTGPYTCLGERVQHATAKKRKNRKLASANHVAFPTMKETNDVKVVV